MRSFDCIYVLNIINKNLPITTKHLKCSIYKFIKFD